MPRRLALQEEDGAWRQAAACRGLPLSIFYEDAWSDLTQTPREGGLAQARAICASCPVQVQCLAGALARREAEGVWAGTTPTERKRMVRKRLDAATALGYTDLDRPATTAGQE